MTRILILIAALGLAGVVTPLQTAFAARKAACIVCQVKHGEAEPEDVRAVRTHQGIEYSFCSEKCAKEFAADPAAFVPASFPRPAPALRLKTLTGEPITNAALQGRVVLLDFWATWCVPCRKSMPELQTLHDKYAKRGFSVIGISIDEGGPAKVKKFIAAKKFTYPIAVDSESSPAWDAWRVKSVPAAFLLDTQGRIVAQWTGGSPDVAEVEAKLAELLPKAD